MNNITYCKIPVFYKAPYTFRAYLISLFVGVIPETGASKMSLPASNRIFGILFTSSKHSFFFRFKYEFCHILKKCVNKST